MIMKSMVVMNRPFLKNFLGIIVCPPNVFSFLVNEQPFLRCQTSRTIAWVFIKFV